MRGISAVNRSVAFIGLVALGATAASAVAGVLDPIGPFVGDASEDFESFTLGAGPSIDIFFNETVVGEPLGSVAPVFVTSGSSFLGSTISAHTGLRFAHTTSPVEFTFFEPIRQFGGYVATNSGSDGGTVEFFDADDELIGTMPLDVTFTIPSAAYTWNGWSSSVPFTRVRITGNGVLEGFLGYDDMQLSFVPGAPCVGLLVVAAIGRRRRRR
ncbi:MAG: hypothetical protein HKO59_11145 [Phycisphaerales bacterium]|nr:hypothetical protein [Phycisphaerales bacterium]NNM26518.1 hypothetical protein [Phycisphaerales bacterium]